MSWWMIGGIVVVVWWLVWMGIAWVMREPPRDPARWEKWNRKS